ncbi:MAG TPA: hypothetical protein VKX40_13515 [Aequorivita sp.]|nr:hypothetical protein [Aequorivita sp.]
MFRKVLVSEDMGSISQGIMSILEKLRIENFEQVQYCDDAYLKIQRANKDEQPFDLLITDLSFKTDHRTQRFPSGEKLIEALKKQYPSLKIIAFSVEDRPPKVREIMLDFKADGFVCKGRNGVKELEIAIKSVFEGESFLSPQIANVLKKPTPIEIDDYDVAMMKLLADGYSQDEISNYFKEKNISPSSLSAIEKRIVRLRNYFNANNSIHLISMAKDLGLI